MSTSPALVIVGGDDVHHDVIAAASYFETLGAEAGLPTRRVAGLQRFIDPKPVTAQARVFLLYVSGAQFARPHQEEFERLVRAGAGVVAIHMSNVMPVTDDGALDPEYEPYHRVLGNRYLSHGPGHHESRYRVEIVGDHPITAGVEDFELFDEHYEFEFADDDHTVLAQRTRSDGVAIPLLYTREVGAGRVVYLALGHDLRAWGEPSFRTLVIQSLQWVAPTDQEE